MRHPAFRESRFSGLDAGAGIDLALCECRALRPPFLAEHSFPALHHMHVPVGCIACYIFEGWPLTTLGCALCVSVSSPVLCCAGSGSLGLPGVLAVCPPLRETSAELHLDSPPSKLNPGNSLNTIIRANVALTLYFPFSGIAFL